MAEKATVVEFGKIIIEESYREGGLINKVRYREISSLISDNNDMMKKIITELEKIKDSDCVTFTIYTDKHTRKPSRIVTTHKEPIT